MKQNKTICRKVNFTDNVFGEDIEYVRIIDKNGVTIIFNCDNKLVIKNFKSKKDLIESYISMYNETEFTNQMFSDLDNLMGEVQEENKKLKKNNILKKNKVLCNKCMMMEE